MKQIETTGLFITFEGGEGAGKTTQLRLLEQYLQNSGLQVVFTREPGGTPEAEMLRNLVVQKGEFHWDALEECLLLLAARASHIRQVIEPNLRAGKVVVCDRFSDSTIAYQGYAGVGAEHVQDIHRSVFGSFEPDLTFLLDIDVEVGLARSKSRLSAENSADDRFEGFDIEFHRMLRRGFQGLAKLNPERIRVVDAEQSAEAIHQDICQALAPFLDAVQKAQRG